MAAWRLGGLVALALSGPCAAEEGAPLSFRVRPSGVEAEAPGRSLDDLVARRDRQNDYLFRSICTHCGSSLSSAPAGRSFSPAEALRVQPGPALAGDGPPPQP